jgi:ketosteroid isomerase-like protein
VFHALYAHARREAQAKGAAGLRLYVDVSNTSAQKAYESLGMNAGITRCSKRCSDDKMPPMKHRHAAKLAIVVVTACLGGCTRPTDTAREQIEIRQVLDRYLQSVKTADVGVASAVWSHNQTVVAVTPLGRFQGWDGVQRDVYVNFLQKTFLERNLQADNLQIQVAGNSAWAVFDWTFTGKLASGQPVTTKGWESHVYERTNEGWRIAHLHYSARLPQPQ